MNNDTRLSINTEVIAKMAELAAKEVDGVKGLAKRAIDLKGAVKSAQPLKGVKIENLNGALKVCVYITVAEGAKVQEVAEQVQTNVKDKIQNMTGAAITKVDVIVADVDFASDFVEEEEEI